MNISKKIESSKFKYSIYGALATYLAIIFKIVIFLLVGGIFNLTVLIKPFYMALTFAAYFYWWISLPAVFSTVFTVIKEKKSKLLFKNIIFNAFFAVLFTLLAGTILFVIGMIPVLLVPGFSP